ncbi:BMP family ABC transporter substrate-binding protein [Diaminobutyricimonas sp. TR449]|uniref:BMP family lipoprotein n=1 Tax=Diaminobutyricimonas sp. TR449 TaxID=2708076 RepID=UPI00142066A8|nr:BMP family ABC transporter substrate-binding protein [Diaminobutyricimonas sp. TR449]
MRITSRKSAVGGLALVGVSALVLAGCAAAPEDEGNGDGAATSDFLPCMVSDAGGFDDKSFNQLGFEGLEAASETLGVEPVTVESAAETDYASNLTNLVAQGCNLIVTVGFALAEAAAQFAEENPEIEFVSIDDPIDLDFDGETDFPNIKPLVYDTAQAAFLAGYLAAGISQTGAVGTFGGMQFPTVTIFMDGFAQGVAHYNEVKGTNVQVFGWDSAAATGTFTGGFAAGTEALNAANSLIGQNIDVLLPVGGPIYQSAAAAIRDSGREIAMVGVDADQFETDPSIGDLLLTSIRKGMDVSVEEAVTMAGEGNFDNTPYVGTLENGGVSIADYHDWSDRVPAELDAEVKALQEAIISGEVKVTSYLAK